MIAGKSWIRNWINEHPAVWEFILFNVLSNVATIVNFIAMWICTGFLFVSLENIPFQFFVFHYTQVESDLGLGGFLSFLVATAAAQAGKTPSGHPAQYRHRRPPGRWTSWKNGSEWFPARSGPYQPGPAEGPVWYSS